jgi:hypothetical protein
VMAATDSFWFAMLNEAWMYLNKQFL